MTRKNCRQPARDTLKAVQEAFRAHPTKTSARKYAHCARALLQREKVGINVAAAIAVELERAGFKEDMLNMMR